MKFLPLALLCLSLPCGFSAAAQEPPADAPASFPINLDKTPEGGIEGNGNDASLPDQSTPFNAAKLLLRALQEKTDWTADPYKSLPATSPFVGTLKLKSILSRMEAVQAYVTASSPERPPFVDEASIIMDGDLAMAYIMLPDRTNPYIYAATAVALIKKLSLIHI